MFIVAILASIIGPAAILFGVYLVADRLDHPRWADVSLIIDVAAAGAGLYVLGMAPEVDMVESTGAWFLIRYTLGIGLMVAGVRFGYESWRLRDGSGSARR